MDGVSICCLDPHRIWLNTAAGRSKSPSKVTVCQQTLGPAVMSRHRRDTSRTAPALQSQQERAHLNQSLSRSNPAAHALAPQCCNAIRQHTSPASSTLQLSKEPGPGTLGCVHCDERLR